MICKECGAYNPDHATYCKVCAANLKGTPAPEAPEVREEEQPTKRFSRPSWVVPEQTEQLNETVEETTQSVEEAIADAVEEDKTVASDLEKAVEETAAEEPVEQLWTPTRARRSQFNAEPEEETEPAEESADDYNDENEGIYNDEEALEDEEDSFEYEPTPPKRKQQKKKNNTMFTVLLIAIIVVIIGVLVAGGLLIAKKMGCFDKKDPTKDNPGASETSQQGGEENPEPTDPASNPDPVKPDDTPVVDEKNADLQKYFDTKDGKEVEMIAITVKVPGNSVVTIDFPHQEDYKFENTDSQDVTRKVKIPIEVFFPNQPLTESSREFNPDITITTANGESYKVNCPSFTHEFPKMSISLTSPLPDENGMIMAPEGNVFKIAGTVTPETENVMINDQMIQMYAGGAFDFDYSFRDDATEDDVETVKIVAMQNNYVTAEKELSVHAYKFIPEPMKLEVRSEGAGLRVDAAGKLTVNGSTLPGATLSAVSDNSTNVLCGSVTVDGEGNFSFQVTTDPSFYGMSVITLNASKEGAEDGSTKFTVIKGFKDKESFVKHYNKNNTYMEIAPKKLSIADLLANQTQYASNNYGFRITAIVVEVINKDGDIIVKMTNNKTNETVYVHNLSEKWAPADNVGGKYNVYCNFLGTYEDTGCPEFIGWFAKKP